MHCPAQALPRTTLTHSCRHSAVALVPTRPTPQRHGIAPHAASSNPWSHGSALRLGQRRRVPRCPAASGDPEHHGMTTDKAFEVLGLSQSTPWETLVEKKNQLLANSNSMDQQMEIEAAYDLLLMQNMKRRLKGELEVSTSVRYADVPPTPSKKPGVVGRTSGSSKGSATPAPKARASLPKLPSPSGLGVAVMTPSNTTLASTQAAVFGALAFWALLQVVIESPESQLADTAGLQLGAAAVYAVYTLKQDKRMTLPKAVGCALGCLVLGAFVGTLIENWVRVDIVPIGSFGSPGVMVAEFVILALGAGALLLV